MLQSIIKHSLHSQTTGILQLAQPWSPIIPRKRANWKTKKVNINIKIRGIIEIAVCKIGMSKDMDKQIDKKENS